MVEIHWAVLMAGSAFAGVGIREMLRNIIDWFLLRKYSKRVTGTLHQVVGDVEAQAEFRRKSE